MKFNPAFYLLALGGLILLAAPVANVAAINSNDNSPVGTWALDGKATDLLGNNGQENGNVKYVPGKVGQAADFDGSDYIEIPDADNLSPSNSGEKMTVAFWMNPVTFDFTGENQGYVNFLGKGTSGNQEWTFRMYNATAQDGGSRAKRVSFYGFNLAGGLGAGSYFQDDLNPNEWIFVTGVIDGSNTNIYKNGVLRDSDSLSGYSINMGNGGAPVRIGTRDLASYFQGSIDNVRVYNRALSAEEITQLYQDDLSGAPQVTAAVAPTPVVIAPAPAQTPSAGITPVQAVTPASSPVPVSSASLQIATVPAPAAVGGGGGGSSAPAVPTVAPKVMISSVAPTSQKVTVKKVVPAPKKPTVKIASAKIAKSGIVTASWKKTSETAISYCAKVTVTNASSKTVKHWNAVMGVSGKITSIKNAQKKQIGATVVLSSSKVANLASGKSYKGISFCAAKPTSLSLAR